MSNVLVSLVELDWLVLDAIISSRFLFCFIIWIDIVILAVRTTINGAKLPDTRSINRIRALSSKQQNQQSSNIMKWISSKSNMNSERYSEPKRSGMLNDIKNIKIHEHAIHTFLRVENDLAWCGIKSTLALSYATTTRSQLDIDEINQFI